MTEHQKLMVVGLDLSSTDESILSFINQNVAVFKDNKLCFVHVTTKESQSDKSDIEETLKDRIFSTLNESEINFEIKVVDGDPVKQIENIFQELSAVYLVLGRKLTDDHQVKPSKLVEKFSGSLLIIPERESYKLKSIGVAVDFSSLSARALKEANQFSGKMNASLNAIHAYQVPTGYHTSGMDHKEYAEVMEENAKDEAAEFLRKAGVKNVDITYVYDENEKPADVIADFAEENKIDLMVMGSEGRTDAASILLNSQAKKLVKQIQDLPLMIVKEKNHKMDLMGALKEI